MNIYTYVTNNPLNYIDPFGLSGKWIKTGGQDAARSGSSGRGAEVTYTCLCSDNSEVFTVTRDAFGEDAGNLIPDTLTELLKDYNPKLFCED